MPRKPRRPRKPKKCIPPQLPPTSPPPTGEGNEERPEFYAALATLLNCTPGNYDHAEGEPASIVTISRTDGSIEPLVFDLNDTRTLVTRLLVSLATYDDKFALKLLDDDFPADKDGEFHWPRGSDTTPP